MVILLFANNFNYAQPEFQFIPILPQQINTSKPLTFQITTTIQQFIDYYCGRGRSTMELGISQSSLHEQIIRRIFRENGIPEVLSRITQALDMFGAGCYASGHIKPLWYFAPTIAGKYGLTRNRYVDESKSFEKATNATAQYLVNLYNKNDQNWEFALAAYQLGEVIVDKLIKQRKAKSFWEIYKFLPKETRNFVPNLLATILISENPKGYAFKNIRSEPAISYELVRVAPAISLDLIAQFSDSFPENIKRLNPELLTNMSPPIPYVIRIPQGKSSIFPLRLQKYYKEVKNKSEN